MWDSLKRYLQTIFGGDRQYLESINDPYISSTANSGEHVTARTAVGLPAFRQGITLLSGDVAKVPLYPYRMAADGSSEVARKHPAYKLVSWLPNPEQSAYEFRRQIMWHAVLYGHGYAWIQRDRNSGLATGLYPLLSDRTHRRYFREAGEWRIESEIDGELIHFRDEDVLHISAPYGALDGYHDNRLIVDCRNAIGLSLAANNFASRFFKKGGRQGGILEIPAGMSDKGKDKLEQGWRKRYEDNDGQFATVILRDNAKFHSAQFAPDESQLTESRQEQVKEVARILNIPAHKLGHDGRTAYNSLEMEERAYVNSTLSHWLKSWEGQCNLKLLREREKQLCSHKFAHDISELIASDSETRAGVAQTYVSNGIKTVNEVRAEMHLPPLAEPQPQEAPQMPPESPVDDSPMDDAPEAVDAVRGHLDALLANQKDAAVKELVSRVKDNLRRYSPESFVSWKDKNFEGLVDSVAERHMGHTVRALNAHIGTNGGPALVIRDAGLSVQVIIERAIEEVTPNKRNTAITSRLNKWLKNEYIKAA